MARRNFGVSMCGTMEYTRRKPKKEYCKGCKYCRYSENNTQMFCTKHKKFSGVLKTQRRKCYEK
jgi:hypothetical protein